MIHTHVFRLVGANVLVATIFALLFFEQGIEFPTGGSEFALLGIWIALFGYSTIIFTAIFLLAYPSLARLNLPVLPTIALAWLVAFGLALPGVSFMTVSVESFLGEIDPAGNIADQSVVAQFAAGWFVETLDIGPTAALFYLASGGTAYLFGGLQFGRAATSPGPQSGDSETPVSQPIIPNMGTRIIWALQADEHYVLVHGPHGAQQVLGRLKDAIAEVSDKAGIQVHRSWWVSRDGIESIDESGKHATITLKSGARVPVSQRRVKVFLDWRERNDSSRQD